MNVTYTNTICSRVTCKSAVCKSTLVNLGVARIALLLTLPLLTLPLITPAHATEPDHDPLVFAESMVMPNAPPAVASSSASIILSTIYSIRPRTSAQLFLQRWAALQVGQSHSQLPPHSFESQWRREYDHPGYGEWRNLLANEAHAMARGQGDNKLTVIVGDSLSQWIPTEFLPQDRFWLNQSISGETAAGITRRLPLFAQTRPDEIYVMVGINDLKNGATDDQVISSLQTIMRQLRHQHSDATVIIHSILPTRLPDLPSDRIRSINHRLMAITQQEDVQFLNLYPHFIDAKGHLNSALTTDGIHLNDHGYAIWQSVMHQI